MCREWGRRRPAGYRLRDVERELDARQRALVTLGRTLRGAGYRFVAPTPETHRRVNERPGNVEAKTLRDVFGWSRPFRADVLPHSLLRLCEEADALVVSGLREGMFQSAIRFATLPTSDGDLILAHSAYPTGGSDAVFFGPDSYRFAALLARTIEKAQRLVDIGCGTGVGGLCVAARATRIVLADINQAALRLAAVNVALAGDGAAHKVTLAASDVLAQVDGPLDAVVANPPYLVDQRGRTYRDGGGALGIDLSVRMVTESLGRLTRGGQLVLYTGSPVVDGVCVLQAALAPVLADRTASFRWEELDPDVFGEELENPAYQSSERIAVVALIATAA